MLIYKKNVCPVQVQDLLWQIYMYHKKVRSLGEICDSKVGISVTELKQYLYFSQIWHNFWLKIVRISSCLDKLNSSVWIKNWIKKYMRFLGDSEI